MFTHWLASSLADTLQMSTLWVLIPRHFTVNVSKKRLSPMVQYLPGMYETGFHPQNWRKKESLPIMKSTCKIPCYFLKIDRDLENNHCYMAFVWKCKEKQKKFWKKIQEWCWVRKSNVEMSASCHLIKEIPAPFLNQEQQQNSELYLKVTHVCRILAFCLVQGLHWPIFTQIQKRNLWICQETELKCLAREK